MSVLDELARSRQVSVTTYRKDGTAVATAVWHVVAGGELFASTRPDAWKVKRLRRDSRVVVAVCDRRGRMALDAASASGTGRLLDEAGTADVHALLARKYALVRLADRFNRLLRRPPRPAIGIAITFAPASGE